MSGRPTADIEADLHHLANIHEGRVRHECLIEAADRLAELDAKESDLNIEVAGLYTRLNAINALCPTCPTRGGTGTIDDGRCRWRFDDTYVAPYRCALGVGHAGTHASLAPTHVRWGNGDLGTLPPQDTSNEGGSPYPDCVDGKVSIEQLAATWRAVWDESSWDDETRRLYHFDAAFHAAIHLLRSVKP